MNPSQISEDAKQKFQAAVERFQEELHRIRSGRAHAGMLDGVTVDAYGTKMPLKQVSTIIAAEPQLLQVTPFDPNNLAAISSAIRDNPALGLNPSDDGRVVRVPIPPLTEERRKEIVKQLNEKVEQSMIAMRNIRHEAIAKVDQAKKDKQLGEDDAKRIEKQIDEAMNMQRSNIEAAAKTKENELLTI